MKSNSLHLINLNLLSSRVLLLFIVFAASLYLGAAGYFLQIKQVGSHLLPLTTSLQPVRGTTLFFGLEQGALKHTVRTNSASGPEVLVPEPFRSEQPTQVTTAQTGLTPDAALATPESAISTNKQSLDPLLDATKIIKEQIRRYSAMVNGDDVLMAADMSGKPAPYGSFEMPNKPFRSEGEHYSNTSDNHPIYNANGQNNPVGTYNNGVNQQLNNMPFSLGDMVQEGLQGSPEAVKNQLQINVSNVLNSQMQQNIQD